MTKLREEAMALRVAAEDLGELLYEKCLAYGGAHNRQTAIWQALLAPHETESGDYLLPKELVFHIPRLTRVLDRILRIVANPATDPMNEDPWRDLAGDALAGVVMPKPAAPEPVCGGGLPVPYSGTCERPVGHDGPCRRTHAGGVVPPITLTEAMEAVVDDEMRLLGEEHPRGFDAEAEESAPPTTFGFHGERPNAEGVIDQPGLVCGRRFQSQHGLRACAMASGHSGPHVDMMGVAAP